VKVGRSPVVDLFSPLRLPSRSSYGLPSFNSGDGFTNAQCKLLLFLSFLPLELVTDLWFVGSASSDERP